MRDIERNILAILHDSEGVALTVAEIRQAITKRTDANPFTATVHTAIEILTARGYVKSQASAPTERQRPQRVFEITSTGLANL